MAAQSHVSRYALWLIPLALPAIGVSTRYLDARVPGMMFLGSIALFVAYLSYFHPDQGERYVEHSPQAAWLMTHVSAAYRPIQEIFVERTLHIDGGTRASAADPDCRLVLVVAAQPDQPCALTALEQVRLQQKFTDGDAAVWIRRDTQRRQPRDDRDFRVMIGLRPANALSRRQRPSKPGLPNGRVKSSSGFLATNGSLPIGAGSDHTSSPRFS